MRVLVVDDDREICQSTALLLRRQGYDTQTAFDGHAAIEQASSFAPSLILLDIEMSDMNGWEVARIIRRTRDIAEPYIAAVSGHAQLFHKRMCAAAGFDHYLTKPVDPASFDQLLSFVNGSPPVSDASRAPRREGVPACYPLVRSQLDFVALILDAAAALRDKAMKTRFFEKVRRLQSLLESCLASQRGFTEEQLTTLQILLLGVQVRLTTVQNKAMKYLH